ncbi:MAG TPA: GNAT family N-acetyltransferase [Streptosporangiaceae bacterium]|nr:GNAT family N-acetyltransferase [Streptosporangiaceae bacterium]
MEYRLETARLRLRRFTTADLPWLTELHGDPAVMRYIDVGPESPESVAAQTLPRTLSDYDDLPAGLGRFAAESADGSVLGWFGIRPPSSVGLAPDSGIEIGYRLFPAVWGRGYATEGASALVRDVFIALGGARVVATTMTVNLASRRVLKKAGLSLVRTFFEQWPTYLDGAEHGDVEYAVTRQEWLARG